MSGWRSPTAPLRWTYSVDWGGVEWNLRVGTLGFGNLHRPETYVLRRISMIFLISGFVCVNIVKPPLDPCALGLWVPLLGFLFSSTTMMNRLFNNKRKKSPESSRPDGLTGFHNVAAGPVSHQSQSNVGPELEGGQSRSYKDPRVVWSDLTVTPDEGSGGGSRIVFQDHMDEDQEFIASEAWASGIAIGGAARRHNPTSRCF